MTLPSRYEETADPNRFVAIFGDKRVEVTRSRERGYGGLDGSGEPHKPYYEAVIRLLNSGGNTIDILDAGCGSGYGSALLASELSANVTGIDLSVEAVEFASLRAPDVNFVNCSCDELPFADDSFHVVMNIDNIEHIPFAEKAIREFHRVLKPRGLYVVSTPATFPGKSVSTYHVREYALVDFEAMLVRGGFAVRRWISKKNVYFAVCESDAEWGGCLARANELLMSDPAAAAEFISNLRVDSLSLLPRRELMLMAAESLVALGEYETALQMASAAASIDEQCVRPMVALGRIALAVADVPTAREAFTLAAQTQQDCYRAWHGLGLTELVGGDFEAAHRASAVALNMAPADPEVLSCYLEIAARLDQTSEYDSALAQGRTLLGDDFEPIAVL